MSRNSRRVQGASNIGGEMSERAKSGEEGVNVRFAINYTFVLREL